MEGITIDQLAAMCKKMQRAGLGKKKVIMSSDDECNEYHQVWTGLCDGKEVAEYVEAYQLMHCCSQDVSEYVVLT
jgi:hypothetical protein